MKKIFLMLFICLGVSFAADRTLFSNPDIVTSYSALLQEKNARNDSLLPALDGDKALAEVLRRNPNLWSLETLDKQGGEVLTKLKANIIYIDGIREEPFCELDKSSTSNASEWFLKIGVDFVSAGSNTVDIHVQQCFNMVRDELGYQVKQGDKIITVPPKKVMEKIKEKGIQIEYVTLHIGLGTFRPMSVENIKDHHMHSEWFKMDEETANRLNQAKKDGRRIIAVGTTSTRTLEAIYTKYNKFVPTAEETNIFIYPGYEFKAIDALITNFHLPKSTLIMLVSAFSKKEFVLNAYQEAIKNNYRFFSFGDSMFIS